MAGIVIGRFWDTRTESARWRRDQKTTSYQRYAEQFQALYEATRLAAFADSRTDTFAALVEHARSSTFPVWVNALSAVWLHGSSEVVTAAMQLDQAVTDLFYGVADRTVSELNWDTARTPARDAFQRFIVSARTELGLPLVDVAFFTEPRSQARTTDAD
ncbi:hypothetical protein ACFXHA_40910 [Nocardia sp. NPDC059240]|uniref:hypothetical protein n=1 Tax=Nocardia sp. NPDC059240 TaxID=3346786 RepID=UPI003687F6CD